jgi:phage-related protein
VIGIVPASKPVYNGRHLRLEFYQSSDGTQIFEFKVNDGRILCFFFAGGRLVLTHGFIKKSNKTPKVEIARAESIKSDFMGRK